MKPLLKQLLDSEQECPVWVWPSPSLRLLARDAEYPAIVLRYAPGVAGRLPGTPAVHYGEPEDPEDDGFLSTSGTT